LTSSALRHEFSVPEQAILDEFFAGAVIGGPAKVGERLRSVAREYAASELMLSTLVPDVAARVASLERSMAAMQ
jgi:alkanesulfonate monooxygenase SsuD/methylene tetrahydromethanopterin reductase-like flavin-dependent oxidoreductase (luciferase family)